MIGGFGVADEKMGEEMVVVEASLSLTHQIKDPPNYSSDHYPGYSPFNIPPPLDRSKWPVCDAEQALYYPRRLLSNNYGKLAHHGSSSAENR